MLENIMKEKLPSESDIQLNEALARNIIKRVLVAETNRWEDENKRFAKIHVEIKTKLTKEFGKINKELTEIENEMKGNQSFTPAIPNNNIERRDDDKIDAAFSLTERTMIIFTPPLWTPLAIVAGLFIAPIVGSHSLQSNNF
jgi:hypothetical protein